MGEPTWAASLPQVSDWLEQALPERADYGPEGPSYEAISGVEDDGWPFWERFVDGSTSTVEIGCGDGRLTRAWAKWCNEVVGVDPNESAIAEERAREQNNVRYEAGDAAHLPLKDESAERVIMHYGCMMYVLRPDRQVTAFREAARVLQPRGWLVVDVNYYPLGHPHTTGSTFHRHHSSHLIPDGSSFDVGVQADLDRDWNVCLYHQVIEHFCRDGTITRVLTRYDQHLYTPHELYLIVTQASLRPKFICGDFQGNPRNASSRRTLLLAQMDDGSGKRRG